MTTLGEFFAIGLAGAEKIGHDTFWASGHIDLKGEKTPLLIFYSHNAETIKKATAALDAAGVLCETPIANTPYPDA